MTNHFGAHLSSERGHRSGPQLLLGCVVVLLPLLPSFQLFGQLGSVTDLVSEPVVRLLDTAAHSEVRCRHEFQRTTGLPVIPQLALKLGVEFGVQTNHYVQEFSGPLVQ
jgi:hypothetical protein